MYGSTPAVGSSAAPGDFRPGQGCEYYSATLAQWIPAKVLQYNPDKNSYNLDCKPDVPPSRMREPQGAQSPSLSQIQARKSAGSVDVGGPPGSPGGGNRPGTAPGGGDVSPVAGMLGGGGGEGENKEVQYAVGMQVEYYSSTASSWIPARIQYMNADGRGGF